MYLKPTRTPAFLAFCVLIFLSTFTISAQVYSTQFTTNAQGWTLSPQQYGLAWIWYNNVGVDSSGGLRTKETPDTTRFFAASPALQLTVGQQYRVKFKTKTATLNVRKMTVAINGQAKRLGSTPIFTSPLIPLNFTEYSTTFTATSATTHVIFYGNQIAGSGAYTFVYLDDVVIEQSNQAPTVVLTASNTSVLRGSNFTLQANAQDADGSITKVEFFKSGVKIGEDLSAPFELSIPATTLGTHVFTAKATDNATATAVSAPVSVSVTNAPPTVALTASNTSILRGSNFTLQATAQDADGSIAKVEFFKSGVKIGEDLSAPFEFNAVGTSLGTHVFTAKATDNDGAIVESALVSVTVTNVPPTVALTASNASILRGSNFTLNATASDADGSISKVEFFKSGVKIGEDFAAPFEFNAVGTSLGTHVFTAKATDNDGAIVESTTVSVMVTNVPPTIDLTASNASILRGSNFTLNATASDADGSIAKVEFFKSGVKIGEDLSAPFEFNAVGTTLGTHVFTAKATDNDGAIVESTTVSVMVTNVLPTIDLTASNASILRGSNFTLQATAQDVDGSIAKVEFFKSGVKIGEDLSAPFEFNAVGTSLGTHTFTAKATDNDGAIVESATVSVMVTNVPPTVNLTTPSANNAVFIQGENVGLKANATDADGSISKVEFFKNGVKIGEDLSAPFEFNWQNATIGTHTITAIATDSDNATATSTALNVTINAYTAGANAVATWNFNDGKQGWTLPTTYVHAFQWYNNQGVDGLGGLRMKLPEAPYFAASPSVNLQAGATYTVSFASRINQASTGRNIRVAYNTSPNRVGATDIATVALPANSYAVPPFVRYNPTFTVPTSGAYNIVFYVEDAGYLYVYLDEIVLEKTLNPSISITSPANGTTFTEGQTVNLALAATDLDGSIAKVEVFANGAAIKTFTAAPYTFAWTNMLPNNYTLTAKTTDDRGNVSFAAPVNMQVNLTTGTLEKYADFSFNQTFEYWWRMNGDWRWRGSGGYLNTGYLYGFSVQANNFMASHGLQLQAGVSYKFQCRMDADNNNKPVTFSVNTAPTAGGQVITTINPLVTEDFLQAREVAFTVPTTGVYYLITSHAWTSGSFQQMKIDQLRIVGEMNKAPISRITTPSTTTVTVAENASLKMRAEAIDFDGTIAKVEYYANNVKVGESATAPYEITWSNLAVGTYKVVTKAFDTEGVADTSKAITVNVLQNKFTIASLIGGSSTTDEVRASVIQPDGTIVLAVNTNGALPMNTVPTFLNNATAATNGTVLRLSADGRTVLSATKLAQKLTDMSADAQGNLFISAGTEGAFKLNAAASQIVWQKTFSKFAHRIDAGTTGKSIVMTATETDPDDETLTGSTSFVYDADGTQLSLLGAASQYTADVAIDEASGTAITIGFKNFNTNDATNGPSLPVYVPVYRGYALNGTVKYVGYDWSADQTSPRWLNRSNNNMADARAVRCAMGKDGKLYIMHEVYGGNHCFRYSPFDIMQTVPIVAGDMYFNFANTGTRVKTFIGRHEPATGAYILGQQFTARINPPLNNDNTVFTRCGNIAADADGRVYITGESAYGIPLTVDHLPGDYIGGAFLLVLSPNLATREACLRLTVGKGRALAVASANHYVFGGSTSSTLYAVNPFQAAMSTPNDGWFAVNAAAQAVPNQAFTQQKKDPSVSKGILRVFPNPTREGQINIELAGLKDKNYQLDVVNLAGKVVFSKKGKGDANVDLSNWQTTTGTYFVRLVTDKYVLSERLMVF